MPSATHGGFCRAPRGARLRARGNRAEEKHRRLSWEDSCLTSWLRFSLWCGGGGCFPQASSQTVLPGEVHAAEISALGPSAGGGRCGVGLGLPAEMGFGHFAGCQW